MADLSITAGNVVPGSDAIMETGTAGETITAGQALYKKASDSKWYKADNNSATAEVRTVSAIALTGSSNNQPIVVQKRGSITIGATMTAGVSYYLSDTAGGICPIADVGAGEDPVLIGMATSTTVMKLAFVDPGVTL